LTRGPQIRCFRNEAPQGVFGALWPKNYKCSGESLRVTKNPLVVRVVFMYFFGVGHVRRKHMQKLLAVAALAFTAWVIPSSAAVPAASQVQVIEFYHQQLDHYFITANPSEAADLDNGVHAGWKRTGLTFQAVLPNAAESGTIPVCRFLGKPEAGLDSHFYSVTTKECADVKGPNFADSWMLESENVLRAYTPDPVTGKCSVDTVPLYRLWNNRKDVNHRYTDQLSVYQAMVAKGYIPEGNGNPQLPVALCVPPQPAGTPSPPPSSAVTPTCTLASSSASPNAGATITLTATCTGTPTSYAWVGCSSTTSTCTTTAATAGTLSYFVTATNAAGAGSPARMDVTWKGTTGPIPICTLSADSATPTVGGQLTLRANCSQAPTRYEWMECSYQIQSACTIISTCSATSTSCTVTSSNPGYAHFALDAVNTAGTGPRAEMDVEWKGATAPPPQIPSCQLTANDANPLLGTPITLTALCNGNPASFAWTNCSSNGPTCTTSGTAPGPQTYSVVAGNQTGNSLPATALVNWRGIALPSCSVSASKTTPTVGETITMTATCTGSPTAFAWTNCTGNGAQCTATSTTPGPQLYSVTGTNGAGASQSASASVTWQGAPTAAPTCSLSASSTTPYTGTSITLTATCSNAPTSYVWTGCSSTGPTCTTTNGATGSQTYAVAASNAIGNSEAASVDVVWSQPPANTDFCSQYPNVGRGSMPWGGEVRSGRSVPELSANGILSISLSVPPGFTSNPSSYGSISVAEFGDPPTQRQITLSTSPCDFRGVATGVNSPSQVDPTGASFPMVVANDNAPSFFFTVNGSVPGTARLVPGVTYYINIRNYNIFANGGNGGQSCDGATCNVVVNNHTP